MSEQILTRPVAVDVSILAIDGRSLKVVLVKVKEGKFKDKWALPGRLVKNNETLDAAARDIVALGVSDKKIYLDQLYCYGDLERDLKQRSVSLVYLALLPKVSELNLIKSEIYEDIGWFYTDKLPEMAFDHKEVISMSTRKLAYKLDEVEVIRPLLPEQFTLGELMKVFEVLSGKIFDKRNFVKKVKNDDIVIETKEKRTGGAFRPAKLYKFR